jgi:hypothetical protein
MLTAGITTEKKGKKIEKQNELVMRYEVKGGVEEDKSEMPHFRQCCQLFPLSHPLV